MYDPGHGGQNGHRRFNAGLAAVDLDPVLAARYNDPVVTIALTPRWCRVRRGSSDVILIAPHGGRRAIGDPAAPTERKVNDLHTADVTNDLAAALDATAIINDGCDRNELDLNRISQVHRRAPWFLDLVVGEIAAVLARHRRAQVLIVHGWNTGQPKCDLGVGAIEQGERLEPLGQAELSVTPDYWHSAVARFRALCTAAGIATPVGERYPAAHRNNLLQLFTVRFADSNHPHVRQLATWASARRLHAVQLELGIPLRWPGPLRRGLHDAAVEAFGKPAPLSSWSTPPIPPSPPVGPLGFHVHEPTSGVTLFTSITPMGSGTAGRLLLFLGGREIALFTGEEPGARSAVGGLIFEPLPRGFALCFDGYASRLGDADLYLDLEAALAASTLVRVRANLHYCGAADGESTEPRPGQFGGTIAIDDRVITVDAGGFLDPAVAIRGPGRHAARTHLAAVFDRDTALNVRAAEGDSALTGPIVFAGRRHPAPSGHVTMLHDGDAYTPAGFHLHLTPPALPVTAVPLARMPILRPLGGGAHARITFGPARFEWDGRIGWGVYEYARRVMPRVPDN